MTPPRMICDVALTFPVFYVRARRFHCVTEALDATIMYEHELVFDLVRGDSFTSGHLQMP